MGSFIPVPVIGTLVGTAVGFVVGLGINFILDLEINGKSIIDYARDGVYEAWNWLVDLFD